LGNRQRLAEQIYATEREAVGGKDKTQKIDEEELKEAMFYRLERLGYRVGLGLVERCVCAATPCHKFVNPLVSFQRCRTILLLTNCYSLTANMPLPSRTDPLDTIKFLCKDLWTAVFRKQIDNLKTNHRGVFVLTDNRFEPLKRCSLEAGKAEEARNRAGPVSHLSTTTNHSPHVRLEANCWICAVSILSCRAYTRSSVESGHRCNCTGRGCRTWAAGSGVSNQDYRHEIMYRLPQTEQSLLVICTGPGNALQQRAAKTISHSTLGEFSGGTLFEEPTCGDYQYQTQLLPILQIC